MRSTGIRLGIGGRAHQRGTGPDRRWIADAGKCADHCDLPVLRRTGLDCSHSDSGDRMEPPSQAPAMKFHSLRPAARYWGRDIGLGSEAGNATWRSCSSQFVARRHQFRRGGAEWRNPGRCVAGQHGRWRRQRRDRSLHCGGGSLWLEPWLRSLCVDECSGRIGATVAGWSRAGDRNTLTLRYVSV